MTEMHPAGALPGNQAPIDPRQLADRILKRDRRRMWLLGIACIIAWMAVVMLPWATTLPMLKRVIVHQVEVNRLSAATPEQQEQSLRVLQIVKHGTIATFISSVASMFIASVCTVTFILLSRRATLRQVHARLAEISTHLKTLANESK